MNVLVSPILLSDCHISYKKLGRRHSSRTSSCTPWQLWAWTLLQGGRIFKHHVVLWGVRLWRCCARRCGCRTSCESRSRGMLVSWDVTVPASLARWNTGRQWYSVATCLPRHRSATRVSRVPFWLVEAHFPPPPGAGSSYQAVMASWGRCLVQFDHDRLGSCLAHGVSDSTIKVTGYISTY